MYFKAAVRYSIEMTSYVNTFQEFYARPAHAFWHYFAANQIAVALAFANTPKETLENQRHSRDNGPVIAGQDWVDGRQTARLLGLRDHHSQEADQTGEVSL
jgi:hypothetical protein